MGVKTGNNGESPGQSTPPANPVMGDALRSAGATPEKFSGSSDQSNAEPSQDPPSAPEPTPTPSVTPAAPAAIRTTSFQEPSTMSQNASAPSATNINSFLSRPVARRSAGEKVREFAKKFEDLANIQVSNEDIRKALQFNILDAGNDQVLMSSVLVTLFLTHKGITHAGVFELIIEDEAQRLTDLTLPTPQGPVTIRRTTSDVADRELWDKAKEKIAGLTNVLPENIHFAGSDVIPGEAVATDETLIHATLYTSTQACLAVLQDEVVGAPGYITIPALVEGSNLQVGIGYADGNTVTSTGLPVRSTLSIALTATEKTQPGVNQTTSLHRKKVELTRVDGYVDMVYRAPPAPAYGQPPKTQALYARYVMTRLDTQFDAITLEGMLLGLASSFTAGYDWTWAGAFLPRYASSAIRSGSKKTTELRDLGAVGLLVPLDEKGAARHTLISTKTEDKDLAALVTHAFNPEMLYTLHVTETGDLSWVQEVFVAAARGHQGAIDKIVRSADTLTGGQFSQRWQALRQQNNAPATICFDDKIRLPIGYYTDANDGTKHDIREIDLLAILNAFGDKDFTVVQRFQNAMDNLSMAPEKRTEELYKILDEVFGVGRYVVTDHATPITFAAIFLQALNEACVAAGADIRPMNRQLDFSGGTGRVAYGHLDQAILRPEATAALFSNGPIGATGRSYTSNVYTRMY